MNIFGTGNAKRVTVEATVIRADGTREPLGVVAYWHKNPLKRWAWNTNKAVKGWLRSS